MAVGKTRWNFSSASDDTHENILFQCFSPAQFSATFLLLFLPGKHSRNCACWRPPWPGSRVQMKRWNKSNPISLNKSNEFKKKKQQKPTDQGWRRDQPEAPLQRRDYLGSGRWSGLTTAAVPADSSLRGPGVWGYSLRHLQAEGITHTQRRTQTVRSNEVRNDYQTIPFLA